jgi:5-methylcytosine-specific restriction protein A
MSARDNSTPGRRLIRSSAWRAASRAFLAEPGNSVCAYCRLALATLVDHVIAHKGDEGLFWDRANWRPCCLRCNSSKAAQVEGGFGHRPGEFKRPHVKGCSADGWPIDRAHQWNET